MKNNIIICLFIAIVGCSTNDTADDTEPSNGPEVLNVLPAKVKIGDTIGITGNNLDVLTRIAIFNEKLTHSNEHPFIVEKNHFITHTENEITLKIPWLNHEEVTIDFKNPYVNNWNLELTGIIPIRHEFTKIQEINVVNEDLAYLINDFNVYKSEDGFYNWASIFEGQVTAIHFINETTGWISTSSWEGTANFYRTENGGDSFDLVHSFNLPSVRKIHFTSGSQGYFVSSEREPQMYKIENDSFRSIFDVYPNLNEQGLTYPQIWDFTIGKNNQMFLLTSWPLDPLIKIDNQNITLNQFEAPLIEPPQILNNTGYILTEKDLYKSSSQGDSWVKISSFKNYPQYVQFINEQIGFAYIRKNPDSPNLLQTTDGGLSWTTYYEFPGFGTGHYQGGVQDFSTSNGLIGGGRSLFKYKP